MNRKSFFKSLGAFLGVTWFGQKLVKSDTMSKDKFVLTTTTRLTEGLYKENQQNIKINIPLYVIDGTEKEIFKKLNYSLCCAFAGLYSDKNGTDYQNEFNRLRKKYEC